VLLVGPPAGEEGVVDCGGGAAGGRERFGLGDGEDGAEDVVVEAGGEVEAAELGAGLEEALGAVLVGDSLGMEGVLWGMELCEGCMSVLPGWWRLWQRKRSRMRCGIQRTSGRSAPPCHRRRPG